MKTKLKGCRKLDIINAEYSQACGMLGDTNFKIKRLTDESNKLYQRLYELNLEAGESKRQQDEADKEAEVAGKDANGTEYVECTTEECKAAESEPEAVVGTA